MTDLKSQKRMASKALKCGVSRVFIEPSRINDAAEAITMHDIRALIKDGIIKTLPKKGASSFRKKKTAAQKKKGRRKGFGSRKGHVAGSKKRKWMSSIRALRKQLKELRDSGKIERSAYRKLYYKSKSGFFRSRSHMMIYIERNDMMKKKESSEKEVANP